MYHGENCGFISYMPTPNIRDCTVLTAFQLSSLCILFGYQRVLDFGIHPDIDVAAFTSCTQEGTGPFGEVSEWTG